MFMIKLSFELFRSLEWLRRRWSTRLSCLTSKEGPNFHQLVGNGPNFKNSHWRSQLLTFCKTLDHC
ncbi:hypothetical protein Hanom_Chr09g00851061 [Helianthus anomalus]